MTFASGQPGEPPPRVRLDFYGEADSSFPASSPDDLDHGRVVELAAATLDQPVRRLAGDFEGRIGVPVCAAI